MKIHNIHKNSNTKTLFTAGLNTRIFKEINAAHPEKISETLLEKDIATFFNNNKIVAWCSEKVIAIIEELNTKYKFDFAFPKGIFVENFSKLKPEMQNSIGFCNLQPSILKQNSSEIIPSRVIFFNDMFNWENINTLSDINYKNGLTSNSHFIYPFLHEVAHVMHENNLLRFLNGEQLAQKLDKIFLLEQKQFFSNRYGKYLKQICNYATTNPLEAVACDIPALIIPNLAADLHLKSNPFINSPYGKLSLIDKIKKLFNNDNGKTNFDILHSFWNGKFE